MIIKPVYNILLLPDVVYYFKKDYISGESDEPVEQGTDVLFLILRDEDGGKKQIPEDFYPIGVQGTVENVSDDENVQIRMRNRVMLRILKWRMAGLRLQPLCGRILQI